jgi:hypothetical protein
MQPLFANQPVLLGILVASLLIWRVMEAIVDIRTRNRLRAGTRRQVDLSPCLKAGDSWAEHSGPGMLARRQNAVTG